MGSSYDACYPVVNDLAGTQITGALWLNPWFWAAFVVTFGLCTVLAGLYPAFVLSSFKPVAVLKGKAGSFAGQLWLRRGLVVLQFAASVVLIGGTAVVYDQLAYMQRMDLGLDLEQVLTVRSPRVLPEGTSGADAMSQRLRVSRPAPTSRLRLSAEMVARFTQVDYDRDMALVAIPTTFLLVWPNRTFLSSSVIGPCFGLISSAFA